MGSAGTVQGEFQGRRRALLIGVTETPFLAKDPELKERFTPLTCAEKDVAQVARALELSDYIVTEHHAGRVSDLIELGKNGLKGELRRFFATCEPGDTAFVYISSHGVTLGDTDYLLAADAQPGDPRSDGTSTLLRESLLAADPVGLQLGGLRPGVTAVICLDACREKEPTQGDDSTGVRVAAQDVVWLYSCGADQRSYADQEHGSWFGRALAHALAPDTPPTRFGEIMRHTEQRMRRLADDEPVDPPTVKHLAPFGQTVESLELCKGYKEPLPWAEMVAESPLWEHTSGSAAVHQRVKAGLVELAEHVGRNLRGAGAHHDDPWWDPASTYPARFERQLVALIKHAQQEQGRVLLAPAETAVLLAAPLVHEEITAVALEDLRQVLDLRRPADAEPDPHARLVLAAVEDVRRAHKEVQSTLETLRGRGLTAEARAAEHWLRHRFIADWDPLWERTGDYQSVDALLCKLARVVADSAESLPLGGHAEQSLQRIDGQLRQVLGHLTVEPGDRPRINDSEHDTWNTFPPVLGGRWRAQELAQLLWTAGLFSADPRKMSSVLVSHLGAHQPLLPQTVVQALSEEFDLAAVGDLSAGAYRLDVRFPCPHPALHAAVEELAGRADASVAAIRGRWLEHRSSLPSLLRGLPERVSARQLVPEPGQYTAPLERFRLAEDEIRPLLMGAQLYGDKMLAVRELYQNALDACRLRDMRDQYGRKQGETGEGTGGEWKGRITFTQGWDDEGRLYIQCEDNGTGMSRAKLTSMFARAGKRYEQDPEFMQERREWRRAGLTPVDLNSRFGIGVFSYFMLAEEIVVTTAPVNRYGLRESLDQASRAEIQSGSGLLRITPGKGVPADGGTRVRLYLNLSEDEQQLSLVETLQSVLWVSDYAVRAVEYARDDPHREVRSREWSPGRLQAVAQWRGSAVHTAGTDVWLVQGEGQLLLDGVVVRNAPEVFGYVANLRERHRPVPSVDRNELLSYSDEVLFDELLKAVPRGAAQWAEVSLRWLWRLAEAEPRLAVAVLDALPMDVTAVLEPQDSDARLLRERLSLASAGCLPVDRKLVSSGEEAVILADDRLHESLLFTRWRKARLDFPGEDFTPRYAPATGLDALIFFDSPRLERALAPSLTAAARAGIPVRTAVKALRRHAIAGVHVPEITDIRGQLSVVVSPAAARLYAAYRDSLPILTSPPAVHAPMVLISSEYDLSLGKCADLLRELRDLDPSLPSVPDLDDSLAQEYFTDEEAELLAADTPAGWTPVKQWRSGELSMLKLKQRASYMGADLTEELLNRLGRMAVLGFSVQGNVLPERAEHDVLTAAENLLLRLTPLAGTPLPGARLSLRDLLLAAEDRKISLGDAAQLLTESADLTGIQAPDVPAEATDWIPPSWVVRGMKQWTHGAQTFGPWELLDGYLYEYRSQVPRAVEELRQAVTALGACDLLGTEWSWDADALLRQAAAPPVDGTVPGYLGPVFDCRPVPFVDLLGRTSRTEDLGDILDRLAAMELHLPLHLPEATQDARALRTNGFELHFITEGSGLWEVPKFLPSMTIQRLLEYAHDLGIPLSQSVRHLSSYGLVGGPPAPGSFTGPDAEALADFDPDVFDLAAFDPGLLGPGTLGALELVLVAGRFGWTLRRTYDRYAPFRCLGLDVTVREPTPQEADIVPDWVDVIVLTERLTGRAPAVAGAVTPDHIKLCAEETDLTEAEVRARLALFASLFEIQLPLQEGDSVR